ncbi:hypothetical protein [Massilia sp. NR 4-1]|uniref:hypothetical protein n=1 Tax=Massilia sp. NR 4-1 TaxID=1678028 RepID=UPI00067B924C|nr:hypothetical protein [Massilia sp. NR 4-1]AKU21879.1 hypothetical protein ACZ75_10775 [Massilia sp. NR 4-1]
MPLTSDRNTPFRDAEIISVPMAANAKIFGGALTVANATGFAAPGSTATTLTYLGRAEDKADNTGGADGAKAVLVRRKRAFKFSNFPGDAVTQADLGKTCFIVDDQTVAKTNGTNTRSPAGRVVGLDTDGVWIE